MQKLTFTGNSKFWNYSFMGFTVCKWFCDFVLWGKMWEFGLGGKIMFRGNLRFWKFSFVGFIFCTWFCDNIFVGKNVTFWIGWKNNVQGGMWDFENFHLWVSYFERSFFICGFQKCFSSGLFWRSSQKVWRRKLNFKPFLQFSFVAF